MTIAIFDVNIGHTKKWCVFHCRVRIFLEQVSGTHINHMFKLRRFQNRIKERKRGKSHEIGTYFAPIQIGHCIRESLASGVQLSVQYSNDLDEIEIHYLMETLKQFDCIALDIEIDEMLNFSRNESHE